MPCLPSFPPARPVPPDKGIDYHNNMGRGLENASLVTNQGMGRLGQGATGGCHADGSPRVSTSAPPPLTRQTAVIVPRTSPTKETPVCAHL